MRLSELAQRLQAELDGPGDVEITGVAGLGDAGAGDLTFLADKGRAGDLAQCRASAVIVPPDVRGTGIPALRAKNPRFAFAQALGLFHELPYRPTGISGSAVIAGDAVIGSDPSIHPCAVIAKGARLGDRVTVFPGAYVGENAAIGDDCVLHANVCVRERVVIGNRVIIHCGAVIGSDGFGFVAEAGRHHKIPQVGNVTVGDDVEIGANTTVDRATIGMTTIKKGTKIDNLVQIAHNVTVGEHCLLAAQSGVAGSSTLGDHVVVGGGVSVTDHITVHDRAMIGGKSGVTKDVPAGQVIAGYPAIPLREWLKAQVVVQNLPELKKRIVELERLVSELRNNAQENGEEKK